MFDVANFFSQHFSKFETLFIFLVKSLKIVSIDQKNNTNVLNKKITPKLNYNPLFFFWMVLLKLRSFSLQCMFVFLFQSLDNKFDDLNMNA